MARPLAVVTGASAGLGAEFARQIAVRGYDLLLVARRKDRLQQVADHIQAVHNARCEVLAADLTIDQELAGVEERLRNASNLELVVNNAGFGALGKFVEAPLETEDRMHRLHVMAAMRLCHATLPGMVSRDGGSVINVSSISGFLVAAGSVSYCATKAWMNRFTEGLYLELKLNKSRVRVQALCPGYTRTEFHQTLAMDTSRIPKWMWLPAERVVSESLEALKAGKLFVIPGKGYRTSLRVYSVLPRSIRHQIGLGGARFRKPATPR